MTNRRNRYASAHASERVFRDHLIHLPRYAKQLLMLISDAAGFLGCVALAAWLHLINPVTDNELILLAGSTLIVAHLLARYLGFYHSIVRYLGMGLRLGSFNSRS